jgi:hypothetical protein
LAGLEASLLNKAIMAGADAFVLQILNIMSFLMPEENLIIADIGHLK